MAVSVPRAGLVPVTLTDQGNAELFVTLYGRSFRYIEDHGWYRWSGWRWELDEDDRVLWAVGDFAESLAEVDPAGRHTKIELRRNRWRAMSTVGMKAILAHAKDAPGIPLPVSLLDADVQVLCTPMGVVNLLTGRVIPPDPTHHHHSRTTSVPPADMPTPRWYRFLTDTFGDDAEGIRMITYVQELLGSSVAGDVDAQVIPFLYGKGKNGKSVLLDVVIRLLGDYADAAPPDFLMTQPSQGHPLDLAELHGRRIVACSEIRPGDSYDEARVEVLTGGNTIKARRLRQGSFSFRPTHTLWLIGNHKPEPGVGGRVFANRLRVIPFERVPADSYKIDNLAEDLVKEEGPGILQWLISGAHRYLNGTRVLTGPNNGGTSPGRWHTQEDDALDRFLDECCILSAPLRVEQTLLYSTYHAWCRAEGTVPQTSRSFAARVRNIVGLSTPKEMILSNQRKFYPGIGLAGGA
ncbi:DNA primase family protein [Streptomyces griseoaurantiacus]|uniref:DNA primase family protein n=1 Tax=Streptomyces griseoaurantiacus TaxID=68213 RepID=UPI0036BF9B5D